jgi:tripartite-type tricarboxylate transporter receptor subunit TctC
MSIVSRRAAACAFGLCGILILSAVQALAQSSPPQSWPQRPVKFILPLGPGSGADIGARLLADRLSPRWGQSIVIENRPGADGIVAITAFINARDDHTLLFGPASSFVGHPYLHDKLPYDQRDLSPIARVTSTLVTVGTSPSLNVGSLKELFAMARAQPGKFNWTTITGVTDIILAGYFKRVDLDMTKVPYRDPVQALNDVAEGRIQLYVAALAIVQAQMQAGRVKVLAVTNRTRAPAAADIPTVAEAGFPALSFDGLVGLFGPPDLPGGVRERIAADIRTALSDPAVASRLNATGQLVVPGTAAELATSIEEQRSQLAASAQVLGIKPKQ